MNDSTSTRWSASATGNEYRRRMAAFIGKALLVGLLAGMAGFAYNRLQFVTFGDAERFLLVPIFGAGVFAHLFAPTLRSSIRLALAGFLIGLFGLVLAWIAPVLVVSYPPSARDALLAKLIREAVTVSFINYSPSYFGGYLLTVCISAFWE